MIDQLSGFVLFHCLNLQWIKESLLNSVPWPPLCRVRAEDAKIFDFNISKLTRTIIHSVTVDSLSLTFMLMFSICCYGRCWGLIPGVGGCSWLDADLNQLQNAPSCWRRLLRHDSVHKHTKTNIHTHTHSHTFNQLTTNSLSPRLFLL